MSRRPTVSHIHGALTAPDSEEQWRVPAGDLKGHSVRLAVSCQPGHAEIIQDYVGNSRYPYRNTPDFLRHAIARHIRWLGSQPGAPRTMTGAVDAIIAIVRDDDFARELQIAMGKLKTQVDRHVAAGNDGHARRLVLAVQAQIDTMPPGYWRDEYVAQLARDHGHLLDRGSLGLDTVSRDDDDSGGQ